MNICRKSYLLSLTLLSLLAILLSFSYFPDSFSQGGTGFEQEISTLEKKIEADPGDIKSRKRLAELYEWTDRYADAADQIKEILKSDPDNMELRKKMIDFYNWGGRPDKAVAEMEQMQKLDPDNVQLMEDLANNYMWSDQSEKAIDMYEKLLKKDPNNMNARKNLADLYTWSSRHDRAIKEYNQVLDTMKTREEKTGVYNMLGENYYYAGSYDQARKYYKRVLEIDPANQQARKNLDEIERFLRPQLFAQFDLLKEKGDNYSTREEVGLVHFLENGIRLKGSYAMENESMYDDIDEADADHYKSTHEGNFEISKNLGQGLTAFAGFQYRFYRGTKNQWNYFVRFIKFFAPKLTYGFAFIKETLWDDQDVDKYSFENTVYYDFSEYMSLSSTATPFYITKGNAPDDNAGIEFSISPIFHVVREEKIYLDLSYTYFRAYYHRKDNLPEKEYEYYNPHRYESHSVTAFGHYDVTDRLWLEGSDTMSFDVDEDSDKITYNTVTAEARYKVTENHAVGFAYLWTRALQSPEDDRLDDQQFTVKYSQYF